tara:strand:- start:12879 stop:13352 length:474 start_codon:yes stop_codon:yes gene_type:complete
MRRIVAQRSNRRSSLRVYFAIAMVLLWTGGCIGSSPPAAVPLPAASPAPAQAVVAPSSRTVMLDDGSYVELRPGVEQGFAHCCGDENNRLEIECSDGLVRCYQHTGSRWEQTYGKHCKRSLNQQCYEQACARVCEAYWELGAARWDEAMSFDESSEL